MALTLPPLNSLRAFEAAARTGSYVAAADELGVSAAAIGQHIRKLEEYLGKEVFMRLNNRVILTDTGYRVFAVTTDELQAIFETTDQLMQDRSRARMVISSIESVVEKWLVGQLVAFNRVRPEFRFDLRVEPDPVDFARHNIDLRISYGAGQYPDQVVVPLMRDVVLPMCSPGFLERNPKLRQDGLAAVAERDLLHTSWGPSFGSNPTWRNWYHKAGLVAPLDTEGFQVGRSSLVLDLAREGLGVALTPWMMAAADVAAGRLVALSPVTLPLAHPYCLVFPHSKARKKDLVALTVWLANAAKLAGI